MKPKTHTDFSIHQVWGVRDPVIGPALHRYKTLAGAKSGLRTVQKDLRKRYLKNTWLKLVSSYGQQEYPERKAIANRLRIIKNVRTTLVVE